MHFTKTDANENYVNRYVSENGVWEIGFQTCYLSTGRCRVGFSRVEDCGPVISYCAGQEGYEPDEFTLKRALDQGCHWTHLKSGFYFGHILQLLLMALLEPYFEDVSNATLLRQFPKYDTKPIQFDLCFDQLVAWYRDTQHEKTLV